MNRKTYMCGKAATLERWLELNIATSFHPNEDGVHAGDKHFPIIIWKEWTFHTLETLRGATLFRMISHLRNSVSFVINPKNSPDTDLDPKITYDVRGFEPAHVCDIGVPVLNPTQSNSSWFHFSLDCSKLTASNHALQPGQP